MDGKGHARIAVAVGSGLTVAGAFLALAGEPGAGIGLALGGWSGWLFTPDADHNVLTEEEKRWKNVPIIGPYMLEVFAGYGAKHKHRGRSHWIVWGTVSRIWYFSRQFLGDLLWLLYITIVVIGGDVLTLYPLEYIIPYIPRAGFFVSWFVGWALQDVIHIFTDIIWSRNKRRKRTKGRKRKRSGFRRLTVDL